MPVMITQNFDVDGGIVNGSKGTLKRIRFYVDAQGNRHLTSCVVHVEDVSEQPLPNLPPKDVPILSDTVQLQFTHPHSKRSCTIRRTQVPIVPAFAMTAHKAQGQSLSNVIIDLQSCNGTEAPYVMVSRATSLEAILILRPFDWSKICCRQSQDTRQEIERINILQLKTKMRHGTLTESAEAQQDLYDAGYGAQENEEEQLEIDPTHPRDDSVALIQRLQSQPHHNEHGRAREGTHTGT
jgi:ATP-dependent exoDNAse (exonuclease V) alpha subunit